MRNQIFPKLSRLSIVVLAVFSVFLLSGCTFFNRNTDSTSEEQGDELKVIEENFSVSLQIIDQEGEEINSNIPLARGESVYELLNKAVIISDNLTIEFDFFEMNGEEEVFVSAINGYNPANDGKTWVFKINGEPSSTGMFETFLEDGDTISFELEALPA